MGVYYFYVNDTKRQYFCVDPSLQDIKWPFVGRNIGSRALSYLLIKHDPQFSVFDAHPMVGSWIGDQISITGDDYDPRFPEIKAQFENIGQQVLEMLVAVSPSDLYEYGGVDWLIYLLETPAPIRLTSTILRKLKRHLRNAKLNWRRDEMLRIIEAINKHRSSEQIQPDD